MTLPSPVARRLGAPQKAWHKARGQVQLTSAQRELRAEPARMPLRP
ncbi:hypothetical protein [Sorangium sp. So ce233]